MMYSFMLDVLQKSPGEYRNFIKLINNGFIYDVRYDMVYPSIYKIMSETLIPAYIRNLNRDLINSTVGMISDMYKEYTYQSSNLSSLIIHDIMESTSLFTSYLQTYNFYDIFSKYVFYDFINIIYTDFIKTLQKNIQNIGSTKSFISIITSLLSISEQSILSVNKIFRYLYRNDTSVYNDLIQWLNIESVNQNELKSILSDYYNSVQNQIKHDYKVTSNVTLSSQTIPGDTIYNDINQLEQQANRTILINISQTNILNNITYTEYQKLFEFLELFIPQYTKIILLAIISNHNSYASIFFESNVELMNIKYKPYNIVNYCSTGSTIMVNGN